MSERGPLGGDEEAGREARRLNRDIQWPSLPEVTDSDPKNALNQRRLELEEAVLKGQIKPREAAKQAWADRQKALDNEAWRRSMAPTPEEALQQKSEYEARLQAESDRRALGSPRDQRKRASETQKQLRHETEMEEYRQRWNPTDEERMADEVPPDNAEDTPRDDHVASAREAVETASVNQGSEQNTQNNAEARAFLYTQKLDKARLHPTSLGVAVVAIENPENAELMQALRSRFELKEAEVLSNQSHLTGPGHSKRTEVWQGASPKQILLTPFRGIKSLAQRPGYLHKRFSGIEPIDDPITQDEIRKYLVSPDTKVVMEEVWHRQRGDRMAKATREKGSMVLASAQLMYVEKGAYKADSQGRLLKHKGKYVRNNEWDNYATLQRTSLKRPGSPVEPYLTPQLPVEGPRPGMVSREEPPSDKSIYADEDFSLFGAMPDDIDTESPSSDRLDIEPSGALPKLENENQPHRNLPVLREKTKGEVLPYVADKPLFEQVSAEPHEPELREYSVHGKNTDGTFTEFSKLVHQIQAQDGSFDIDSQNQLSEQQVDKLVSSAQTDQAVDAILKQVKKRGKSARHLARLHDRAGKDSQSGDKYVPDVQPESELLLLEKIEAARPLVKAKISARKQAAAKEEMNKLFDEDDAYFDNKAKSGIDWQDQELRDKAAYLATKPRPQAPATTEQSAIRPISATEALAELQRRARVQNEPKKTRAARGNAMRKRPIQPWDTDKISQAAWLNQPPDDTRDYRRAVRPEGPADGVNAADGAPDFALPETLHADKIGRLAKSAQDSLEELRRRAGAQEAVGKIDSQETTTTPEPSAAIVERQVKLERNKHEYSIMHGWPDPTEGFSEFSQLVHRVQNQKPEFGVPRAAVQLNFHQVELLAQAAQTPEEVERLMQEVVRRDHAINKDKGLLRAQRLGGYGEAQRDFDPSVDIGVDDRLARILNNRNEQLRDEARQAAQRIREIDAAQTVLVEKTNNALDIPMPENIASQRQKRQQEISHRNRRETRKKP